ncbi:type II toxin-antitoxin system RelE/ParE family toxin [Longimicrobium sp.]|uniref:type II toxin-antitoxin system RelE/ParE family toxin n=1 Tax=Longimicrobium sp. TaxID=2029185 RepID=UPI002EDA8BD6
MNDDVRVVLTEWFDADLRRLDEAQRGRIRERIRTLERKGWRASASNRDIAELENDIWEIRVVGSGPAFRCLFFVVPGVPGRAAVLTACVSKASIKRQRVMAAEIKRAEARRAQWLTREGIR